MAGPNGGIPMMTMPTMNDSGGGRGETSNRDLMTEARESLSGNWGMGLLGYVLYGLLAAGIMIFVYSSAFFVSRAFGISGNNAQIGCYVCQLVGQLFMGLISGPMIVGVYAFYLGIAQENEGNLDQLFVGFRRFWRAFAMYFMYSLIITLWSLLFIIPGIVAAFSYSMAFFCMADDDECGPMAALYRSRKMMKGNKMKFFCLNCRFIGWSLLATVFSGGIGYLWLVPYMQTSYAKFYEDIR